MASGQAVALRSDDGLKDILTGKLVKRNVDVRFLEDGKLTERRSQKELFDEVRHVQLGVVLDHVASPG